ncbi:hypothetical protein O3G_MSEX001361 [Manduca sexta]|uniref:Uncharacterized protein n=1 Tax=Manduca sexta TaxID=7130 RepID=A0A921YK41_MANSE|nr:hypothetical protein O3G_MSEX001361 [Manduca sexta]
MERYIIREPRANAEHPPGNQMIAILASAGGSNVITENIYYNAPYKPEYSTVQHVPAPYMGIPQKSSLFPQPINLLAGQGQMSGIDPRYLASFGDNTAQFIVTGPPIHGGSMPMPNTKFGINYENRNVVAPERNKPKNFIHQRMIVEPKREEAPKPKELNACPYKNFKAEVKQEFEGSKIQIQSNTNEKKPFETESYKDEAKKRTMSRLDKLQEVYKSGPRAFSGPVDKVLKWHKSLQDIGVLVIYEIVAKCVSVSAGDSCAKNLVVRDENGPAMQVVYYEIDFLLPELKPPCTVRVVGKMMLGTCRLHAFNVRMATGDDVAMLPRRAAVATHHVAKLCKEYASI